MASRLKRRGSSRRTVTFVAGFLLLALNAPAGAEMWQWIDEGGTTCFAEDLGAVPKKFRKKAKQLGLDEATPDSPRETPPEKKSSKDARVAPEGTKPAVVTGKETPDKAGQTGKAGKAPAKDAKYGGKTAEAWQAEFAAVNQEMNEAKRLLGDTRNKLFGQASGLSRQEYFTCQKDLADQEKKYTEIYNRKQALSKAADAAGVPDDLRW